MKVFLTVSPQYGTHGPKNEFSVNILTTSPIRNWKYHIIIINNCHTNVLLCVHAVTPDLFNFMSCCELRALQRGFDLLCTQNCIWGSWAFYLFVCYNKWMKNVNELMPCQICYRWTYWNLCHTKYTKNKRFRYFSHFMKVLFNLL